MLARVKDIIAIMEEHFPLHLAESWDNPGLQVGSRNAAVERLVVALDMDEAVLHYAVENRAGMIVTHHPLFFKGLKKIDYDHMPGRLLAGIVQNNLNVYSAHTNLDAGDRGLNQILAERLGLMDIKPLQPSFVEPLYKLVVYVPAGYENQIREAVSNAGAGHIGRYSGCSFRSQGTGTFIPTEGTNPFIGTTGRLEEVQEYRLETIVGKSKLGQVVSRMLEAHPYEEPAYDLYLLENTGKVFSLGRTGRLNTEMSLKDLCLQVKKTLNLEYLRVTGDLGKTIKKAAVVSGAGASFFNQARNQHCDVLITGDLKYHEARDAEAAGLAVIDAGHQGTEQIVCSFLAELLQETCQKRGLPVKVLGFTGEECIKTV